MFVYPAAVIQSHLKSRRYSKQILPVTGRDKDTLACFRRKVELAGAYRQQYVKVGVSLAEMRIEDPIRKRSCGYYILIRNIPCFRLHYVTMGPVCQRLLQSEHDMVVVFAEK